MTMNINIKRFLVALTCVLLASCSSRPSEITWYQLNDNNIKSVHNSAIGKVQTSYVELTKIKVPDYLKQSKLVMRTAPFEMHFAASHLWVQTPEKEIRAALLTDLNAHSSDFWFVNFDPIISHKISNRLSVEITHFYPTENSEVMFTGYWSLHSDDTDTHHPFHFTTDLQADGYGHAVAKQRSLISLLSKEITAQIRGN